MAVLRPDGPTLIDVLDRVLDKGIVIDAWMYVSIAGIDLMTITTHVIVASFDTYLSYSVPFSQLAAAGTREGFAHLPPSTWPPVEPPRSAPAPPPETGAARSRARAPRGH